MGLVAHQYSWNQRCPDPFASATASRDRDETVLRIMGTPTSWAAAAVASSPSGCTIPCTPIGARKSGEGYVMPKMVVCPTRLTPVRLKLTFACQGTRIGKHSEECEDGEGSAYLDASVRDIAKLPRNHLPLIELLAVRVERLVGACVPEDVHEGIWISGQPWDVPRVGACDTGHGRGSEKQAYAPCRSLSFSRAACSTFFTSTVPIAGGRRLW